MCEMCEPPKRYLPSVGDIQVIDNIQRQLGTSYAATVFRRWRVWLQEAEGRADEEKREAVKLAGKLSDAETMCTQLRERLAKADKTITADMDVALRLLNNIDDTMMGARALDELRRILTSVRKRYGPETKTTKPG
jgi:hypothetical protein